MSNQSTFSSLTRVSHAAAIAAITAMLAVGPVGAQETRTLTDDSGAEVTFPAAPQRIVTLHDSQLTIR